MELGLGTLFLIGIVFWIVFRMITSNNEAKRLEREEEEKDKKMDRIQHEIRKMVVTDWWTEGKLTDDEYEKWLDPVAQSEEWKKKNKRLNNELWYVVDDRCWRQYPDLFDEPDDEYMGYGLYRTYGPGDDVDRSM